MNVVSGVVGMLMVRKAAVASLLPIHTATRPPDGAVTPRSTGKWPKAVLSITCEINVVSMTTGAVGMLMVGKAAVALMLTIHTAARSPGGAGTPRSTKK